MGFLQLQAGTTEHIQRANPSATKGTLPGGEFGHILVKMCCISTGAPEGRRTFTAVTHLAEFSQL